MTDPIETVDVTACEFPLADAFPTSYGDLPTDHLYVRVSDGDHVGYGEGSALRTFTGETAQTMALIAREHYAPAIEGHPPDAARRASEEITQHIPGHPGAAVGVEAAILDLKARQAGIPLRDLLGPTRRTTVPCIYAIGALTTTEAVERVEDGLDAGYTRFKVKADGNLADDATRVNEVTNVLASHGSADELSVRVDANTGWKTAEQARHAVEAFESPEFIEYIEQPISANATADLRLLRQQVGIPIFADESVHGLADARNLTREPAAVTGIYLKLAKTGSLREWTTMAELAGAAGHPVTPISAFDTSLGVALTLHLSATVPRLSAAAEVVPGLVTGDPAVDSLKVTPETPVPERPGVGVDLSDELFE
ncbi:mandelate racemase/muconate lactonizing enzyme family protein [Halegenticoccus tardaugens]|uniref:mandelate racemase/muconate lactonizing enzyme family protein n=1 Tax=Halegenticoccus tardaugens TaxID=2071624 RepID=UPI0013E9953D|nr:enolase C-terminal domain-like protein [Halegenticoccus tardaugens]